MSEHAEQTAWRTASARTYIEPYREHPGAAIAVLGGSSAQGVADRWSDCDTVVYWDEIDADWLETPRARSAAGSGNRFTWLESYPGNAWIEQYRFGSLKADVAHVRLGWLEARLDTLLDLPRELVKAELDDLVERTLELVEQHLPEVDTAAARRTWSLPAAPCEEPPR